MLLLAALLVALAAPTTASAKGGQDVIRDCAEDGDLDGDYSQQDLDDASKNMPSDISEYSNCRDVIERARERGVAGADNNAGSTPLGASAPSDGSGGGGTGGTGGAGNDLDELESRSDNSHSGAAPDAAVAGEDTGTAGGTYTTNAESDDMPIALIVALLLAAVGAFLGALYLLRDRLPSSIASRLPGPLKPDSQA